MTTFSPFFYAKSFAVEGYFYIITSISRLLKSCNPMAILFVISIVVVLAVYLQAFSVSFGHIRNEIINIMPPFTNGYASFSINAVFFIIGIMATSNHADPYFIEWVSPGSMCSNSFSLEASTTFSRFTRKAFGLAETITSYINRIASTITLTLCVIFISAFDFVGGKNCKTAIFLAWVNAVKMPINHFHNKPPCFPFIIAGIAG